MFLTEASGLLGIISQTWIKSIRPLCYQTMCCVAHDSRKTFGCVTGNINLILFSKFENKFVELQNFKMTFSRFLREEFKLCKLIDVFFFFNLSHFKYCDVLNSVNLPFQHEISSDLFHTLVFSFFCLRFKSLQPVFTSIGWTKTLTFFRLTLLVNDKLPFDWSRFKQLLLLRSHSPAALAYILPALRRTRRLKGSRC